MASVVELDTYYVERRHEPDYCGLLFFILDGAPKYLPWTVTFLPADESTVRLYPHDDLYQVVDTHQDLLANAAFDAAKAGRESRAS